MAPDTRPPRRSISTLALRALGVALLLQGCAGPLIAPADPEAETRALIAQLQGPDIDVQAADLWLNLAERSLPPKRQAYVLAAIQRLTQAKLADNAAQLIETTDLQGADADTAANFIERRVALRTAAGDLSGALAALQPLPPDASPDVRRRLNALRIELLEQDQQPLAAAYARIDHHRLLTAPEQRRDNNARIAAALNGLSVAQLDQRLAQTPDTAVRGWLALTRLGKTHALTPERLRTALAAWQAQFADHSAGGDWLNDWLTQQQQPIQGPRAVAVLLPLSGRLADIGATLRDGLMTAYFELPAADRPTLTFFDTEVAGGLNAYLNAYDQGAEAVIGPLRKTLVDEIAQSQGVLPIPVLALNRSASPARTDDLYQFGLAPEDDAVAVAQTAFAQGLRKALVIAPVGDWGDRVTDSFATAFTAAGGQVLAAERLSRDLSDLATPLQRLLKLDESHRRHRTLQAVTDTRLDFQARRRADADLIFLAAFPRQARLVKPLLRFYQAETLPVYATAHVYSGRPDPIQDQDLQGVIFSELPWLTQPQRFQTAQQQLLRAWPSGARQRSRFIALGFDALNILPYIRHLRDAPGHAISGATGDLFADASGVLHRRPDWARFNQGRAVALNRPPADAAPSSAPIAQQQPITTVVANPGG